MQNKDKFLKTLNTYLTPYSIVSMVLFLADKFNLIIYVNLLPSIVIYIGLVILIIQILFNILRKAIGVQYKLITKIFIILGIILLSINSFSANFLSVKITLTLITLLLIALLVISLTFQNKNNTNIILFLQKKHIYSFCKKHAHYAPLIIFLIFIIIRVIFIILYKSPYIDEYLHILSGQNLIQSGNLPSFVTESAYTRGFYVSFFIGLLLKISSNNIVLAKLFFLIISSVNFYLLLRLARKIKLGKEYTALCLFLYSISPYVIFNHIYIRMFVFYEFFLLLIVNIFCNLIDCTNKRTIFLNYAALLLLNVFLIITKEFENYIFILLSIIFVSYGLFYEIQNNKIISSMYKKLLLIILLVVACIITYIKKDLIFSYLNGKTVTDGIGDSLRYYNFFFKENLIHTIFLLLSIPLYFINKNKNKILISVIFIANIIFVFHQAISPVYKVLRGIMYYLPLFILISIWSIKNINLKLNLKILLIIATLFIGISQFVFFIVKVPEINKEINFFDYKGAYTYVKNNCTGTKYALIHSPNIGDFYGVRFDGIIYLKLENLLKDDRYYLNSKGTYNLVFDNTPVITDPITVNNLLLEKNICIVTATELRHSRLYVTDQFIEDLGKNLESIKYYGLTIYRSN